jgi:hypothetical protein
LVGPISGAGRLVIGGGSTLELAAGSGQAVTFEEPGPPPPRRGRCSQTMRRRLPRRARQLP